MSERKLFLRKLTSFGASTVLLSAITFLSIPITISVLGTERWASFALGQAIGEVCRVIVTWSWNSVGITRTAALEESERFAEFTKSLAPRAVLLAACLGGILIVTFSYDVADYFLFTTAAAGGAMVGLTASWYFISIGDSRGFFVWSAAPRAFALLLGSLTLLIWPEPQILGYAIIIGAIFAILGGNTVIFRLHRRSDNRQSVGFRKRIIEVPSLLRQGFGAFSIGFIAAARLSVPILMAPTVISSSLTPLLALSDKIVRWSNTAATPCLQVIQSRLPKWGANVESRALRGSLVGAVVGFIGSSLVFVTTPPLAKFLTGGSIDVDYALSGILSIIVFCWFSNMVVGNSALGLLGRTKSVAGYSLLSLFVGIAAFFPLVRFYDVHGAFMSLAIMEIALSIILAFILGRSVRRTSRMLDDTASPHQ
ncbi:O-antigen/teichoic acid export membrane protein [Zhihengliuella halotolerans]|uniref:O-antigen/teichoic acid export membrane protein n=1 Tax=Zhihengliuella halotolerans TaxID=370736 RepID=A0A4Q8A9R7_9MICC|nr:O-antigen/teichoic acid export membrane protein [Zhihengliuella halotolerans]